MKPMSSRLRLISIGVVMVLMVLMCILLALGYPQIAVASGFVVLIVAIWSDWWWDRCNEVWDGEGNLRK